MSESAYIDSEQDALQALLNKLNGFVPLTFPFRHADVYQTGAFIRGGASSTNLKA